jgi:hypothetical protein
MGKMTKNIHVVLLILVSIIIFVSHSIYTVKTQQYPEMDEQNYMDMVTGYYKILQHATLNSPVEIIQYLPYRQPGYPLLVLPVLLILGLSYSYKIMLFANVFFYIGTMLAVYGVSRFYFGKTASLLSSILFATYGWSLFYLHFTYSETATTFFTTVAIYYLLKSKNFSLKNPTILFGVTFGLALLTRWVSLLFVAGPLIVSLTSKQIYTKKFLKKHIKIITVSILLVILFGIWPYILNISSFFGTYVDKQMFGGSLWTLVPQEQKHHVSLQSAAYYFKIFEQLSIFHFTLFIVGGTLLIWKRKGRMSLILAFLIPYLAFSFATIIKADRYIVPIYPIMAIISLSGYDLIMNKILKRLFVAGVLVLSVFSFFGCVWGIGPMGKGLSSVLIPMPLGHPRLVHTSSIVWPPTTEQTNARKLFEHLQKLNKKKDDQIVFIFSYHPIDNPIYSLNKHHTTSPLNISNFVSMGVPSFKSSGDYADKLFSNAQIIVTKSGTIADNYFGSGAYKYVIAVNSALKNNPQILNSFEKVETIKVPKDNSTLTIYIRKQAIPRDTIIEFSNEVNETYNNEKVK